MPGAIFAEPCPEGVRRYREPSSITDEESENWRPDEALKVSEVCELTRKRERRDARRLLPLAIDFVAGVRVRAVRADTPARFRSILALRSSQCRRLFNSRGPRKKFI